MSAPPAPEDDRSPVEGVPSDESRASFAPPAHAPQFVAPASSLGPAAIAAAPSGAFCRACGNGLDPRAVICPSCGVPPGHGQPAPVMVSGSKSGGVAILLSLLITGAGHWYTGEVGRGFAFFGGAILAAFSLVFLVGFVALPAVWVWAAIDANKSAERHNLRVAAAAAQQPLAIAR